MITFKELRYKNFLSTGDQFNIIKLDKSPTSLILGDNGSGKSTMLDALTYVLFSKPYRKINKPQLINSINGSNLLVEVEFTIGSKKYLIRRGIKPGIFEIFVDDNLLNQDAKTKDYQEKLEKQILKLNYKSFTQIIILGSSSFQPFMQLPLASRRDVIEDLLDIQIFSIMNQLLKERVAISKNKNSEFSTKIELNEEKIRLVESYKKEAEEINNDRIQKIRDRITEIEKTVQSQEEETVNLERQIDTFMGKTKNFTQLQEKHDKFEEYYKQIARNIKTVEKEINLIDEVIECPTCEQEVPEEHKGKILADREVKMGEYESATEDLEQKLIGSKGKLTEIYHYQEKIKTLEAKTWRTEYEIREGKKNKEQLNEEIVHLEKVRDKSVGDDERIKQFQTELNEMQELLDLVITEQEYQKIAFNLLKDSGIKTLIIKQYLPIMNTLINQYLTAMDSYFNFELDESFNETIKSRYRDEFSYDSFSEGEKMRIDLALLFTWRSIAKLKNSANTNLLILDEVFDSSLDTTGTDEFLQLIHGMDSGTNVFIISHKGDSLFEKFDNIIRFEKVKNFSKVV